MNTLEMVGKVVTISAALFMVGFCTQRAFKEANAEMAKIKAVAECDRAEADYFRYGARYAELYLAGVLTPDENKSFEAELERRSRAYKAACGIQ